MSYWISLVGGGPVERFTDGGTYAIGGSTEAELNITYNYGQFFPFRDLDGMTGAGSEPMLAEAVKRLGTERDESYWAKTPGNAGHALSILLGWARQYPEGVWEVR